MANYWNMQTQTDQYVILKRAKFDQNYDKDNKRTTCYKSQPTMAGRLAVILDIQCMGMKSRLVKHGVSFQWQTLKSTGLGWKMHNRNLAIRILRVYRRTYHRETTMVSGNRTYHSYTLRWFKYLCNSKPTICLNVYAAGGSSILVSIVVILLVISTDVW